MILFGTNKQIQPSGQFLLTINTVSNHWILLILTHIKNGQKQKAPESNIFYWLFVISLQFTRVFFVFFVLFFKKKHTPVSVQWRPPAWVGSLALRIVITECDVALFCSRRKKEGRKQRTRPKNQTLGAAEPRQLTKTGAKSQNKVVNLKKLWSPQTNQKGPAWTVHHEKKLMTCVPTQPFSMFECPITDVLPGRKRFIMPKRLRCFSWKLKSVSFKWV